MGCNYLLKSPPQPSCLSEPIFLIFCCIALLLLISRRKIHIATINISHCFLFVEPFMKTWCMKLYSMSLLYYKVFIRLHVKVPYIKQIYTYARHEINFPFICMKNEAIIRNRHSHFFPMKKGNCFKALRKQYLSKMWTNLCFMRYFLYIHFLCEMKEDD